ncbi:hypothetical protein LTS10_012999 [Elasticomyces elasticus]|nr:hypothetical protein LTS10_012999 [Elasticomyces elasticus]
MAQCRVYCGRTRWQVETIHGRPNNKFEAINIPVSLACDGNRRKELNMIKKSKGFNWGAGATGCMYWKGPLLRDVLLAGDILVNFEDADEPSEGKYETCIPLSYAMDPTNDVLLAYEMNDVSLPPDHGYPVRLLIPGYVDGRCVKWLAMIWTTDYENTSHYHIWDNRVLPSFVTEKDGEVTTAVFSHPDTACNEQNLNSIVIRPAQGEKPPLTAARKSKTHRLEGYAYDGGGHEVQCGGQLGWRRNLALLYSTLSGLPYPARQQVLDVAALNTQPEKPSWNTMGMMNNCWCTVKSEISQDDEDAVPHVLFGHPVEPGTGDGGWTQPSEENKIANAKQEGGTPQKQFTRQEIGKHDREDYCWIVVGGKPGGKAAIVGHAGKVHQEASDEFELTHDGYAYQKLKECVLGVVTQKAADFMKTNAEADAKEKARSKNKGGDIVLQKHRWVPVKLPKRLSVSEDTRRYTFGLPDGMKDLGLGTCQHIQLRFHLKDKMLIRSYTPTRPLLPDPSQRSGPAELTETTNAEVQIMRDAQGEITYSGNGTFHISGKEMKLPKINLVLGGSGLTPGYALIARALLGAGEEVQVCVVDANKSEADIPLREELEHFVQESKGRLKVAHVLSHPSGSWQGSKGYVNADMLRSNIFPPREGTACSLCGPSAVIQKAAVPALRDWGFEEDKN